MYFVGLHVCSYHSEEDVVYNYSTIVFNLHCRPKLHLGVVLQVLLYTLENIWTLQMYNEIYESYKLIIGEQNPDALITKNIMALCMSHTSVVLLYIVQGAPWKIHGSTADVQ